uniref:Uncharacterized protein n=1 Tax=Arundo donax TaxID=35708 RepID=A0A0A9FEN4_ARUDO
MSPVTALLVGTAVPPSSHSALQAFRRTCRRSPRSWWAPPCRRPPPRRR